VDQGTDIRGLEPTNAAQPSSAWKYPVLHGVWVGGSAAYRSNLWGA
jgi:hypothetical protein